MGFAPDRLKPGEIGAEANGDREAILVLVEGKAKIEAAGQDRRYIDERMDIFEKLPPHALYVPNGAEQSDTATTDCTLTAC